VRIAKGDEEVEGVLTADGGVVTPFTDIVRCAVQTCGRKTHTGLNGEESGADAHFHRVPAMSVRQMLQARPWRERR
jgi:hypothetical protein